MAKKFVVSLMLALLLSVCCQYVFAQYGDQGVGSSLDRLTDWLTRVLGAGLVVVGIVIIGIRMAVGDREALQKGIWVIVGGLLIFLAKNLLNLIKGFAGQ